MNTVNPPRPSGSYAVIQGRAYRASTDVETGLVTLFWRHGEGPPPDDGFEFNADRSGALRQGVASNQLADYYRLTTTGSYGGVGPFEVELYPKDAGRFWLVYRGDDPESAARLPGMAADRSMTWGYRMPEIVGLVPADAISDVVEAEVHVTLSGRRGSRAHPAPTTG